MASRRLPGQRDPSKLSAPPPKPPPELYDIEYKPPHERPPAPEPAAYEPPPGFFGPRVILLCALLAHAGLAVLLVPRMIRALDRIFLSSGHVSMSPMQFLPVVTIGALAFGVFLWAWIFRGKGWAITFCILSAGWWVSLCFVIF